MHLSVSNVLHLHIYLHIGARESSDAHTTCLPLPQAVWHIASVQYYLILPHDAICSIPAWTYRSARICNIGLVLGNHPMHQVFLGGVRIPVKLSWSTFLGMGFAVASPAGVILNRTVRPSISHWELLARPNPCRAVPNGVIKSKKTPQVGCVCWGLVMCSTILFFDNLHIS